MCFNILFYFENPIKQTLIKYLQSGNLNENLELVLNYSLIIQSPYHQQPILGKY